MSKTTADILQEYVVKLGFQTDAVSAKKFDNLLGSTGKKILGVGAAVTGMVVAAERGVSAFADQMEKLHYNAKLSQTSVAKLKSFSYAAEQIGLDGDAAAEAIRGLAMSMKLMPGTTSLVEAFGISVKGRETADVVIDLLHQLKKEAPMVGAMWAQQLLGMDQSTFLQTMDNLDALTAKYREHQATIKDAGADMTALAEKNKEYNNRLREIGAKLDILGMNITANFISPLLQAGGVIDKIISGWIKLSSLDWTPEKGSLWDQWFGGGKESSASASTAPEEFVSENVPERVRKRFAEMKSGTILNGGASRVQNRFSGMQASNQGKGSPASAVAILKSHGWTHEQAVGIAANLQKESSFNPGAVGDSGQAYGIAQWHPDRQAAFKKFAGKDIQGSSMEEQLAFLTHELRSGGEQKAGSLIAGASSSTEAARLMSLHYERPAGGLGEANLRGAMAARLGAELAGNSRNIAVNQQTTINVTGSDRPNEIARSVAREQVAVNSRIVRDFKGQEVG